MNSPLVSVIIPAFNAGGFISETLDSVFAQAYRPMEVIVVDDGSDDKTSKIVKNYQPDKQDRLVYIYQKNSGPSAARNAGIRKSNGKYITFLDADDLWPKGKLQKQVELMEGNKEVVLLFGNVKRFSEERGIAESMFIRRQITKDFFGDKFYVKDAYRKLLTRNFIPTGTVIIRREYFQNGVIFDENLKLVEDWDLWLRIAMNDTMAYSTDVWELKRDHKKNVSHNNEAMQLAMIEVLKKHEQNFEPYLRKNSLNFKSHLCGGYFSLGVQYLESGQKQKAREAFLKSLHSGINIKSIFCLLSTFFHYSKSKESD